MDNMSDMTSASRRSVGNGLAVAKAFMPGAPTYDHVTGLLVEQVHKSIRLEAEKKRNAIAVLFPPALGAIVLGEIMAIYPEYRLIPLNSTHSVHDEWNAHRFMAMHLCIDAARQYTNDILIMGDGLYQCATRDLRRVHLETDPRDAFGIHARHASAQEYVRTARSRTEIEKNFGYTLSSTCFRDFIQGQALHTCTDSTLCTQKAEAIVIDLSMHALTVTQACTAVLTAGASFAEVFMPYTADVFMTQQGEFQCGGGVGYNVRQGYLEMMYPEGVAGVTHYPTSLWGEWLNAMTVTVHYDNELVDFRLELTQNRGPFMYCRLVKIEHRQMQGYTRHALEMPWAEGKYVFTHSRLISGSANPNQGSSWETVSDYVPQTVVDKLYIYALSLEQQDFTPENILRRASKIDSRVIVSGVNVRIREPMEPRLATEVAGAIYAKAFVARYESSKLGTDLIAELNKATAFSRMGRVRQLSVVFASVMRSLTVDAFHTRFDQFRSVLTGFIHKKNPGSKVPTFNEAPKFLLLEEYNRWFLRKKRDVLAVVYGGHVSVASLRGGESAVRSAYTTGRIKTIDLPTGGVMPETRPSGDLHDDIVDMSEGGEVTDNVTAMVHTVSVMDDLTRDNSDRLSLPIMRREPEVKQGHFGAERFDKVPDPASAMNDVESKIFPGMAMQDFGLDDYSLAYDPQHRQYEADYLEHPIDDPIRLKSTEVYRSKVKGYQVAKKSQTLQATLTALSARNMAAPAMRKECDETSLIESIWARLKLTVFAPDAEDKLETFRTDKVGFDEELLKEWGTRAKNENVQKVLKMAIEGHSFEDSEQWVFDIMLKSDQKPPLSTKPMNEAVPPQVIASTDKHTNGLLSSIFRLMSRRLLSLMSPNILLGLIKSTDGIRDHIAANHPWGEELVFLENDFSKFDKSQDRFAYMLMIFVMKKLGFDQELLDKWYDANENCTLRSMALGIILLSQYQNKSGSAATALMNVVVNLCAVITCYAGTDIVWASFMGDDSIVACRNLSATQMSLDMMAEKFNFEAKFFILKYPYFTSCFILFNVEDKKVYLVPDPIKRCQRYSMSVSAENPMWEDKFRSANEALIPYRYSHDLVGLDEAVRERYSTGVEVDLQPLFDAIATLSSSFEDFRSMYEEIPTVLAN